MDARDQLRRYLEQRRDMGETELVLDGMAVDEVLAIIGGTRETGGGRREEREPRRAVERERPLERGPSPDRDAPASSVETPRVSFSGPGVGDWREALRAAGAAPVSPVAASVASRMPSAKASDRAPRILTRCASRDSLTAEAYVFSYRPALRPVV